MVRNRPAPKSVKQSRIMSTVGSLGESSSYESDSGDQINVQTPRTLPSIRTNQSEFHSPDADDDVTDYGLEFTTSRSSRRCSTLKTFHNEQQQSDDNSNVPHNAISENPSSVAKKTTQTKPIEKVKQKAQISNKKSTSVAKEQPPKGTNHVVKRRRKQRTPKQLDKRFWKEVKFLQNHIGNLIPKLPFSRVVREIMLNCTTEVTMITRTAIEGLQVSSELFLTQVLQDAYVLTLHRGRLTLDVQDIDVIKHLKLNFL